MRGFYLRHEIALVTIVSSVLYIVVGMYERFLLNWIVGPIWPIACAWVVPSLVRRALHWDEPLPDRVGTR